MNRPGPFRRWLIFLREIRGEPAFIDHATDVGAWRRKQRAIAHAAFLSTQPASPQPPAHSGAPR